MDIENPYTAALEDGKALTNGIASSGVGDTTTTTTTTDNLDPTKVAAMIQACEQGQLHVIQALIQENALYASQQDQVTGQSPLMAAAVAGNGALCQYLLDCGAPWNAVDRQGYCAGNYATDQEHWGVVNLLVDWGVKAELILGTLERSLLRRQQQQKGNEHGGGEQEEEKPGPRRNHDDMDHAKDDRPVEYEPSIKPDYLQQRLSYTEDGRALLDSDRDAVMMEWERPLMRAHAQILMQSDDKDNHGEGAISMDSNAAHTTTTSDPGSTGKTVLNVGFGMGIIDSILQDYYQPAKHYIVEAHPDVYQRMLDDHWHEKPNVVILFGKWQDVLPPLLLLQERKDDDDDDDDDDNNNNNDRPDWQVDAIFFDTYGEHALDMQDFHTNIVARALRKPNGIYSFFNGLAPDNLFFHGVACQCVKLQLAQLGLNAEFCPCEIQAPSADNDDDKNEWNGIRRPYWHGRNVYYLPRCTWNAEYLATGTVAPNPLLALKTKANHEGDNALDQQAELTEEAEGVKRFRKNDE
ncbi:hypothetical protein ACA910_008064 [Epithemia clementina (nom. ined.)]